MLRAIRGVLVVFILMSMAACAKQQAAPQSQQPNPSRPQYIYHEVKYSGETLGIIAAWYTGRATNWTVIRDANPGIRPERIRLGQEIRIPTELIVQDAPMPASYPRKFIGVKQMDQMPADAANATAPAVQPPVGEPETAPAAEATAVPATTEPVATPEPAVAPTNEAAPAPTSDDREKLLDDLMK